MADPESFREETRRWLVANAPASMYTPPQSPDEICWGGRKARYPNDVKRWLDMMAERGWTAPTWPRAYGGGGLAKAEAKVLAEEMAKLRLRPPLTGFGLSMIGPLLLQEGSEELRREHLPPIVRGEIRWCQGYSEPGAGSDLASLQTRAVRDGDVFVLNGQKVWTSFADKADWVFLLVRLEVGAGEEECRVRRVCERGPHPLPVHHEDVAVTAGPGLKAGQVGARARLGVALAPADHTAHA